MEQRTSRGGPIERELTGSAVQVGGRTLQPVARVAGRTWPMGQTGAGAWFRISPVEVVVTESDGRVYRVAIRRADGAALRWLVIAGALVAALSWIVRRAARGH